MSKTFNTAPVLDQLGGALSLLVMAGLTAASIAAWSVRGDIAAQTAAVPAAVAVVSEAVTEVVQLPAVIVTVKRAAKGL